MKNIVFALCLLLGACGQKKEHIKPVVKSITESIYASGNIVSVNQYQAYATVSGIVNQIYVSEGDFVKIGSPILSIAHEAQELNKENARLSAEFAALNANQGKLKEAELAVALAKNKMGNDSLLWVRQQNLWAQKIGAKIELEQRELAYQNAKNIFFSATEKYRELKRQLALSSAQSKNNLGIISDMEGDYTLKSMINGVIYGMNVSTGEIVTPQKPLATVGDDKNFLLEMQVDEYDIVRIKKGMRVMVVLDSYKESVFEASITKINPLMNVQSKTFLVEATFVTKPEVLFPNITFEANILIQTKDNALLIPRTYLINDSMVTKSNGEAVAVKTGLKDYEMVEIISGIGKDDELIKPIK